MRNRNLSQDQRGASTVEIALVLPVLILFIYGIFVVATMFQANAGMQHALGEGARYANLYPTPTNPQIAARMDSKVFGSSGGTFTSSVADAPSGSSGYKTLTVTYTMPVNFLFFTSNDLNLTRTKKVYTAS
ncbi:MAG: TadE/TadG family type IV pilus assembly protein [Sphingomicrobium sp.]